MKNDGLPANSLTGGAYTDSDNCDGRGNDSSYNPEYQGLTKREVMASMAMQGMLSSKFAGEYMTEINDSSYDKPHGLANNAVRYADALLSELEKQGG